MKILAILLLTLIISTLSIHRSHKTRHRKNGDDTTQEEKERNLKEYNSENKKKKKEIKKFSDEEVLVKEFFYNSKYGLLYLLTNGFIGAVLNDITYIILEPKTDTFLFIYGEKIYKYTRSDIQNNSDLNNKFKILLIYKDVLIKKEIISNNMNNIKTEDDIKNTKDASDFLYVRNWWKIDEEYVFSFSNKQKQFYFKDKTQIIISLKYNNVIYINKEEVDVCPLDSVQNNTNNEMVEKYHEAKGLLKTVVDYKKVLSGIINIPSKKQK